LGRRDPFQMVRIRWPDDTEGAERGLGAAFDGVRQGWVGLCVVDVAGKYGVEVSLGKQLQEAKCEHLQFLKLG